MPRQDNARRWHAGRDDSQSQSNDESIVAHDGMPAEDAERVASMLYPHHALAAALLIQAATSRTPSDARDRAAAALRVLDPDEPIHVGAVAMFAQAIAELVSIAVYEANPYERRRLAKVLDLVLAELEGPTRAGRSAA